MSSNKRDGYLPSEKLAEALLDDFPCDCFLGILGNKKYLFFLLPFAEDKRFFGHSKKWR